MVKVIGYHQYFPIIDQVIARVQRAGVDQESAPKEREGHQAQEVFVSENRPHVGAGIQPLFNFSEEAPRLHT